MRFFDAHNHLQDPRLRSCLEPVTAACARLPVAQMVVNGTTEADWPEVAALAARFHFVLPSFGVHPWRLRERSARWEDHLRRALDRHPDAAVGEFGLDRWIQGHDVADQTAVFRRHVEIAVEYGRPLSVHCLRAWDDLLPLLEGLALPPAGFLLHAYSGPATLVPRLVRLGAYFSFSGYFLNPGQEHKREVFRAMPADRLLVETDAPDMPLPDAAAEFCLPGSEKGKAVNHPANIRAVYLGLARLRGSAPKALSAQVETNFYRVFGNPG